MPTLVNLGAEDQQKAQLIRNLFQTDFFRIRVTNGIKVLELASAFKNVYAIACGTADGLGFGTNTRVKLMLLAIEEFEQLRKKLGYDVDINSLPATIGDLILTCSSEESRNYTFGKLLASYNPHESLYIVKETVEGYHTSDSVLYFEEKLGVSLPLAHFIYDIVHLRDPASVRMKFNEFVKRV